MLNSTQLKISMGERNTWERGSLFRRLISFIHSLLGVFWLSACMSLSQTSEESGRSADVELQGIYQDYWQWKLTQDASYEDERGRVLPADRLPRVSRPFQDARVEYREILLEKLTSLPAEQLSGSEYRNVYVLKTLLEQSNADAGFREYEMPFNSDSNFWSGLSARDPLPTIEEYQNYIGRMRDIPRYFSEQTNNMRAGLARGFSVPRITLEGRAESIRAYLTKSPEDNPFYTAFVRMPAGISELEQSALQVEAQETIIESVLPAYQQLLSFFEDEYLPQARSSISASTLPDGEVYYLSEIREYTTLDLGPEEIHRIGLREVARIEAEMAEAIRATGFEGTAAEFREFLLEAPQFYAETPEELLMASSWVAKRVDQNIGEVIGLLPRRRFGIVPVPAEIAPFYTAGRGGLENCMINTHDLPSRPLYSLPALTLHECMPGHSMQVALGMEGEGLPAFRRNLYFSSSGEGWGLYSEYLGVELGIYRTPYELYGRLSYEMWRAARLVIDTGIHHYGWSRQDAIDYLAVHTALSDLEVENEVDRYISWPAQALSYKLGELTIKRLRADVEAELGEDFDQRAFHDAVLAMGSVPLPLLEAGVREALLD